MLSSRLEYLDAVHRVSEEIGRAAGLTRTQAFELSLAVREAFVNALTHGNSLDCRKKVRLTYRVEGDAVRVSVGDEGSGFSLERAPDPLAPDNLTRSEGRGIFLMRNYVDELKVRPGPGRGAVVCLLKRRRPAAARRAAAAGRRREP